MEVFMRLNDFGLTADDIIVDKEKRIPEDIQARLFSTIKMEYEDAARDKESYIHNGYSSENFLLGLTEPEKLIERALAWNDEIKDALCKAMTDVFGQAEANTQDREERLAAGITLDTDKTYALSQAAREADNHWYDYADHAVLFPNSAGFTYFQTIIPDAFLADIKANPQDYVVITVYPK